LAGNSKHEVRNPKQRHFTEYDLKKQSQFAGLWPEIRRTPQDALRWKLEILNKDNYQECDLKKQSQFASLWLEIRSTNDLQNTI